MRTPRWHAAAAASGCALAAALLATAALAAGAGSTADLPAGELEAVPSGPINGPVYVAPVPLGPAVPDDLAGRVAPNGTDLFEISRDTDHGLPRAARSAYRAAARTMNTERPQCDLPWELVAGIGRVESDHGRYDGSRLGVDGVSRPLIRGVALDGVGPVAAIPDTDDGRLDGDRVWDRAVGPMQFIPSTWRTSGRDGDGDGRRNPDDLDDAALATAGYLCPASGTILDEAVMRGQVFAYNHDEYYVDLVIAFAIGYHTGVFDIPAPPPVEVEVEPTEEPSATRDPQPTRTPSTQPTQEPTRDPTRPPTAGPTQAPTTQPPSPTQQPTQQPTPQPPTYHRATGPWTACGTTWCIAGVPLDLGPEARYDADAAEDFDADGTPETNRAELDGLVGQVVTVHVRRGTVEVYLINGLGYRNADGSFS